MPRDSTTLFADAIDVRLWLQSDRGTPYAERVRRDRQLALQIERGNGLQRVRRWWHRIAPDAHAGAGARLGRLRGVVTVAMIVLGAVTGSAVTLTAFAYDGSHPVNVVRLLALLVGVQVALLALTLLLLLPGRVPGLRGLQDLLRAMSPGAWAAGVFRKLARPPPDVARLFDGAAGRATAARFAKWQILYWAQCAAVAFNVAALALAIMLVTFSDLAFGWSTTLDVDPAAITRLAQTVAWPWHGVLPAAVPSAELVEQSQFFRLDGGDLGASSPRVLGAWWPFTVAAIVTYGFLPRFALLLLAAARLRAATAALLLDDPAVTALLDRMAAPEIETAAAEHEAAPPLALGPPGAVARPITGTALAVVWEDSIGTDAVGDYARRHLALDVEAVSSAGGGRGLAADRAALDRLAAQPAQTIVVFTPAWEPPLLELLDFLGELRRRVGTASSIVVAPVPDSARAVTEVERETWTRAIARLADPKLYVETGAV